LHRYRERRDAIAEAFGGSRDGAGLRGADPVILALLMLLLCLCGCVPSGTVCVDQTFVLTGFFTEPVPLTGTITVSAPAGTKLSLCIR
jgi:hypothetical protein